MTAYFLDTSALAKRYIAETGSKWIQSLVKPSAQNQIVVSAIIRIEMVSLLGRRQREGTLTQAQFVTLRRNFLSHLRQRYLMIDIDEPLLARGAALSTQHMLRSLDAIQLASAVIARRSLGSPVVFLSADQRLLTAAQNEGFLIDDPNNHP